MKERVILSVIVPIYNSESFIKESIESILQCKSNEIELILIDDGSTDKSGNICDQYLKENYRVRVIHQKNLGVSSARNKGIDCAKGKYIMFVDSDDVLYNWEFVLEHLCNKDIYYFSTSICKNCDKVQMLKYITGYNDKGICFAGPFSKIFKKQFLMEKKINFKSDLINGEDMFFNIMGLLECESYSIINRSFYKYRNIQGSATKKFDKKIIESDIMFHTEMKKYLETKDIDKNLVNEICLFSLQMAIVIISNRISYIKRYEQARKYYRLLCDEPYRAAINSDYLLPKKNSIILTLLKHNKQHLVYILYKVLIWLKMKKGEYFYII